MFKIKSSTYYSLSIHISITWKKKYSYINEIIVAFAVLPLIKKMQNSIFLLSHTVNINIIYNANILMVLEVEHNPDFYAIIFPFSFVKMWQH